MSKAKVVGLDGKPQRRRVIPNKAIEDTLKGFLKQNQQGRLKGIMIAVVTDDNNTEKSFVWKHDVPAAMMLGAWDLCREFFHEYTKHREVDIDEGA